jgi:hypothetical protein
MLTDNVIGLANAGIDHRVFGVALTNLHVARVTGLVFHPNNQSLISTATDGILIAAAPAEHVDLPRLSVGFGAFGTTPGDSSIARGDQTRINRRMQILTNICIVVS